MNNHPHPHHNAAWQTALNSVCQHMLERLRATPHCQLPTTTLQKCSTATLANPLIAAIGGRKALPQLVAQALEQLQEQGHATLHETPRHTMLRLGS